MNFKKTLSIAAVSVVATLAVASVFGFQMPTITAADANNPEYLSAEGVTVTAIFKFREGEEMVPIQLYTQVKGFQRTQPFVFDVEKIVGNTPILHKHVDESFLYRNSQDEKQNWNPFDVEIILNTGPYAKRAFTYSKCFVDDYKVVTLSDKEEGYFNKGFAVVEDYVFECRAMEMHNPSYDEMMNNHEKAQTTSTLDLKEPFSTWSDHFKYSSTGSLKQ